ncbi:MAG: xanthine dehydrogenase family protein molybdopterin-binding subunit [Acidobacteria bacterium]|nr:xanthine dehydrogenase family protein molybdopterin-binding subunit [Acidobacteriota bacterium]
MSQILNLSRRDFIRTSALGGSGLILGVYLPSLNTRSILAATAYALPNAFLKISSDGLITCMVHKSEMGQGIMTSLPMILAEELEANWSKIRVEFASGNPAYETRLGPGIGWQLTGGSNSVRGSWTMLRKAGAAARQMLVEVAAQTWGVSATDCRAEQGSVVHSPTSRRLSYGELVEKASSMEAPQDPVLKSRNEFRFIGKKIARLDTPSKVNGAAIFGIDVKIPGLLTARVLRSPVFGGKVRRYNDAAARQVKGVSHVLQIESGVAVVAENFWAASQGLKALEVEWDEGENAALNSAAIFKAFQEASQKPGVTVRNEGNAKEALAQAKKLFEAVYEVPFLAHATMEPMNCTAHVRADGCEVWAPTQFQTGVRQTAAKITGLPDGAINVHTTLLGGGFGRRAEIDFVAEAVEISKAVSAPVKVVWSREDDMQHDFYRPANYQRFTGALDENGLPRVWMHHVVGPSIMSRFAPQMVQGGVDPTSVEGASDLPYSVPHLQVEYTLHNTPVPPGFWRSVGNSINAFTTECFLDELAAAGGKDPYELRRQLLDKAPRHKATLELAATKAAWDKPLPPGRFRGIAVHESYGSYVAAVVELSVEKRERIRVHRVVCAIDCGMVVNPDTVTAQVESGVVYGMTATLKGEITIEEGRIQQKNFNDYPLLRMDEMPAIEVYTVPDAEGLGGVGEPAVPPMAPAIANALFFATGKRIRKLPIRPEDLRKA